MPSLANAMLSSVGKKIINAAAGLGLCGFIVIHLLGNVALLTGKAEVFNKYSHYLASTGFLLYIAEGGMVLFFLGHMITGTMVWLGKLQARPEAYQVTGNAGGASKKTFSSRTMIYTGAVLLIFLIIHLKTFKYGPGIEQGYVVNYGAGPIWDLYRLTVEAFKNIWYVGFYSLAMLLLGFHLRHGFWSGFQSLGANHPRYMPIIQTIGVLFAIVMAAGFLIIPIVIYLKGVAA